MKLYLEIDYHTEWGQSVYVCGSTKELGGWDEQKAIPMNAVSFSKWSLVIEVNQYELIEYKYIIKKNEQTIRQEEGERHSISTISGHAINILDEWHDKDFNKHLYTSGFTDSFFAHSEEGNLKLYNSTVLLRVKCAAVDKDSVLKISGDSLEFGEWDIDRSKELLYVGKGVWQQAFDLSQLSDNTEYKFIIYNKKTNSVEWEVGANRTLPTFNKNNYSIQLINLTFQRDKIPHWKGAGVAIPVFSLRSAESSGVGDFLDLRKIVDWAALTKQRVIQILPINDTTSTFTNADSYPYSAISVYALHPIYLGLANYSLSDEGQEEKFKTEFSKLNELPLLDYENTLKLKLSYLRILFAERGKDILSSKLFKTFYAENEEWLFPYACFCYLRDNNKSCEIQQWGEFRAYNEYKLSKLSSKKEVKSELKFTYFCQYLLHEQLLEVKKYAHSKGVILKGDIPIGVDPNSVDVWVEPHLFNLDTQTGAPPDDFAIDGQNWGFPTYNWEEMSKDGYLWWIKRFRKMADYFDAYRIDHILGFFRIWEIPSHSVQGLLGYFNPALPYSIDELSTFGFQFHESMVRPYIEEQILSELFGEYTEEVKSIFLDGSEKQLKEEFNTQKKIQEYFKGKSDDRSLEIRDGLYQLCNEVLFIQDRYCPDRYHPRISVTKSHVYNMLEESQRHAFYKLYEHFFYHRHNDFWRDNAMKKLPVLISSTDMLACGEDLGMIPDSVPAVMRGLQILSLEIERMSKGMTLFADLSKLSYLSVCSTSTHDMSPIRAWWRENRELTQHYYNEVLKQEGIAPSECSDLLCKQILENHLYSPSMLVILPLQDWLSISESLRRTNSEDERINIPSEANHYWGYRMHINIETLINAKPYNEKVAFMIECAGRQ